MNYYRTPTSATERVWSARHAYSAKFIAGLFLDDKRDDRLKDFYRWVDAKEMKSLEENLQKLSTARKKLPNESSKEKKARIAQQVRDGSRFILETLECLTKCFK